MWTSNALTTPFSFSEGASVHDANVKLCTVPHRQECREDAGARGHRTTSGGREETPPKWRDRGLDPRPLSVGTGERSCVTVQQHRILASREGERERPLNSGRVLLPLPLSRPNARTRSSTSIITSPLHRAGVRARGRHDRRRNRCSAFLPRHSAKWWRGRRNDESAFA